MNILTNVDTVLVDILEQVIRLTIELDVQVQ